ncbi:CRISPR system precrRNA processing endoribonuclease RAMP protein Cas6 [Conchiformibius steedae]|uniref:CRISPR system precrRNA processing endoribonuclease RAMP protein Cas6 n=1 Tax=Conchiformibius steedae TaxID=153493 RepID=A0A3P2A5V1_9NEIS|nr:CRISPR system precrRNA processing endoribonuclease RAMP protein Cas6 [Conchiformibius steedae]RRD89600.1 CRISPR system precrRNA processing endoribonuclease RAMP protein Cas6 [Conchiformibius steedae]
MDSLSVLPKVLPLARYRYTFCLQRDLHLPAFAGSTLRGVWGHALLDLMCTCPTGQVQHHRDCPYRSLFEAPAVTGIHKSQQQTPPQPYVLEVPAHEQQFYAAGRHYSFQMVLFGTARLLLPMITAAWVRAFDKGVGKNRATGKLAGLAVETAQGWQDLPVTGLIPLHPNQLYLPQQYPQNVVMHLNAPLRIQRQRKPLYPAELNTDALLRQVFRRVSTVSRLYWQQPLTIDFQELMQQAQSIRSTPELHWYACERYSNRQHKRIPLGGVLGQWRLENLPPWWAELLYIGQWLHIGKETVFGLGAYRLEALSECTNL